ncbi:SLC13 family permease [Candidatus Marinimicrobia bacterium]|jgi:di/tricarboxylate transporter|nr:SLC13 family permease [Candidatus Neomarinimicrobiota bacterium]
MDLLFSDQIILFLVISLMIVLFSLEVLPLEVSSLSAVALLLLFNVISLDQAISGFSNQAVITIGCIFVLSRSLVKTGFLEVLARFLYKLGGNNPWLTIFIFLFTVSIVSGFINNTAAVAIFIPVVFKICQRFHISPTKVLLPLSYAAILGGTLTLVGTSTNLIVSSIMEDSNEYFIDCGTIINPNGLVQEICSDSDLWHESIGNGIYDYGEKFFDFNNNGIWDNLEPISMFEFTYLGLIFLLIGIVYIFIVSRWFLPSRAITSSLTQKYHVQKYLTEFKVGNDSKLIGKTFRYMEVSKKYGFQAYKIIRHNQELIYNLNSAVINEHDVIIGQIHLGELIRFKEEMKVLLLSDVKINQNELMGENYLLVEGLITHQSSLIDKTLSEFDFRHRFSAFVLAIKRQKELLREKIAHIKLKFSDTILIMVPRKKLESLKESNDLIVLEELDIHLKYQQYWWLSILVIPIIMILSSFGIISIVKGVFIGAVLLLVLKVISIQDAYESIDWSVIFLIAALIPIGQAINITGADLTITKAVLSLTNLIAPFFEDETYYFILISILYLISMLLSSFLSNAAVAIVFTPIAITLSYYSGIDPRPLIFAVCLGSSNSFLTPIGYQTNMMVYAPGQYRFNDFIKVGLPLSIILWITASFLITSFWPIISLAPIV